MKWTRRKVVVAWNVVTWAFILIVGLFLLLRTGSPISLILVAIALVALAFVTRKYRLDNKSDS